MSEAPRANDQALMLAVEDSFNTKNSGFSSDVTAVAYTSLTPTLKNNQVANESVKTDGGSVQSGQGVPWLESQIECEKYLEGAGYNTDHWGYVDSETPTSKHGFPSMISSCLGEAASARAGTTVKTGSSPTTTAIALTNTSTGRYNAGDLIPITLDDGTVEVRPIASVSGTSDEDATLGIALSAAPSADNVIPGGWMCRMGRSVSETIQGTLVGDIAHRTWEFFGGAGSFNLPETRVHESQRISFTHRVGSFTYKPASPVTRQDPQLNRSRAAGGGEFMIAQYGNSTALPLEFLQVSVEMNREYDPQPQANDLNNELGCWIWATHEIKCSLLVRPNMSMPNGLSSSTWYDAFTTGGEDESLFHILLNYGNRLIGRLFCLYLPAMWLDMEPEHVTVDRLGLMRLNFVAASGYAGYDKARVLLA